jgi:hypothetical protein
VQAGAPFALRPFLVQLCPNSAQTHRARLDCQSSRVLAFDLLPTCVPRPEDQTGNDVVTFKDRARLVTRNGHADFLADSSPHHVAHGCSPQIVKKQTLIFQFVTGPIFPTTRAVIFRIYWCLARRAQQVPDACRSAGIRPNLAKIGDRPALYAAPFFRTDRVKTVEEGPPSNE